MYFQTAKKDRIKFSNPLRDYSHLLSGRLIATLIKIESIIYDFKNFGSPDKAKGKKKKTAATKELPNKMEMQFLR